MVDKIKFKTEEYIDVAYYDMLCERFAQKMETRVIDSIYFTNKYLTAAIVACIEGHIYLDADNNSWYSWMFDIRKKPESENAYLILNIYEFIEQNNEFFDFITKYFNLWHDVEVDSEFIYDVNHRQDLERNYRDLIYVIEKDIKTAKRKKDNYIVELYNSLGNALINTFDKKVADEN